MGIERLFEYIGNTDNRFHGVCITKGGKEIAALIRSPESRRYPIYSAVKTILGMGVGFLVQEGRMDTEKPLYRYLSDRQRRLIPENRREDFSKLSVERFLTMTVAGYPFRPQGESGWEEQALGADIAYAGCNRFEYSNFPALLVSAAAQNAAGEDFYLYLCSRLFEPLGIDAPPYRKTPEGYFYGASGMELSVRELARIGQRLLELSRGGGYFEKAVSPVINTGKSGYGYFTWADKDYFYISGKWGQKCIAFRNSGVIITYLSDRQEGDEEAFRLASDLGNQFLQN